MKTLSSYIREELNQYKYTIPELKVTWSAPDKVYVQVPSNMDDEDNKNGDITPLHINL